VQHPTRNQYRHAKRPYKSGRWPEYEAGLRRRGELTIWFSEEAIRGWRARRRGRPGGQRRYANLAIETALTVRAVYRLPLRQAEGFLRSIVCLLGLDLPIPDHTTLSRRGRRLGKLPLGAGSGRAPVHLVIDSTGLRVHVGQSRIPPKRRAWRKLNVAVDRHTGEILAADLSRHTATDAGRVPKLLSQVERPLAWACADGAYDREPVYSVLREKGRGRRVRVVIPPLRAARVRPDPPPELEERNRNIRARERLGPRRWWKASGATLRSKAENAIFRYKQILGREMSARTLAGQRVEVRIGAKILNRMAELGMPESYSVS